MSQNPTIQQLFDLSGKVFLVVGGARNLGHDMATAFDEAGRDRRVYPEGMAPQPIDCAAAKAAIIEMTKDGAAFLEPDGIRVNVISPDGFERGQPEKFIEAYSDKTPMKRMGRDGIDLKGAAVFLASEASTYVTGHNLVVGGEFSMWQ